MSDYSCMYLVPKGLYNELFESSNTSMKNKLAAINVNQVNNYEINDQGKVNVKNNFTDHALKGHMVNVPKNTSLQPPRFNTSTPTQSSNTSSQSQSFFENSVMNNGRTPPLNVSLTPTDFNQSTASQPIVNNETFGNNSSAHQNVPLLNSTFANNSDYNPLNISNVSEMNEGSNNNASENFGNVSVMDHSTASAVSPVHSQYMRDASLREPDQHDVSMQAVPGIMNTSIQTDAVVHPQVVLHNAETQAGQQQPILIDTSTSMMPLQQRNIDIQTIPVQNNIASTQTSQNEVQTRQNATQTSQNDARKKNTSVRNAIYKTPILRKNLRWLSLSKYSPAFRYADIANSKRNKTAKCKSVSAPCTSKKAASEASNSKASTSGNITEKVSKRKKPKVKVNFADDANISVISNYGDNIIANVNKKRKKGDNVKNS